MFTIQKFQKEYYESFIQFLRECLPESGRSLELDGRHKIYCNIEDSFEEFWCLFDDKSLIGTAALKRLNTEKCELKAMYLLKQYQGRGLGYQLLQTVLSAAEKNGYQEILLDTLASSTKAIALYEQAGFVRTERYNSNYIADVFMKRKLEHES